MRVSYLRQQALVSLYIPNITVMWINVFAGEKGVCFHKTKQRNAIMNTIEINVSVIARSSQYASEWRLLSYILLYPYTSVSTIFIHMWL